MQRLFWSTKKCHPGNFYEMTPLHLYASRNTCVTECLSFVLAGLLKSKVGVRVAQATHVCIISSEEQVVKVCVVAGAIEVEV